MKIKKKNKAILIIITAIAVLVLMIIFGSLFAFGIIGNSSDQKNVSRNNDNDTQNEETESMEEETISEEEDDEHAINLEFPKDVYMVSTLEMIDYEQRYEQLLTVNWDKKGDVQNIVCEGDIEDLFTFYYEEDALTGFAQEDEDGNRLAFVSDEDGNIIEEVCYDDGEKEYTRTYEYDANGNLLVFHQWDEDDKLYKYEEYRYNDENICIYNDKVQYHTDTGEVKFRTIRKYDEEGGLIAAGNSLNDTGELIVTSHQDRIYSDDRKVLDIIRYDENDEVDLSWKYTYDDKGNTTSYSGYYPDGSLYFEHVYTYDEHENMLSEHCIDHWQNIDYTIEYTYDEYGNMLSETKIDSDGEMLWTKKYTYQLMNLKPYQIRRYEQLHAILNNAI